MKVLIIDDTVEDKHGTSLPQNTFLLIHLNMLQLSYDEYKTSRSVSLFLF